MPDEADSDTTTTAATNGYGPKRPWPMWLAAALAAITAAAAVVSVVAWKNTEQDADDAEAHAAEQVAQVDQLTSELQAGRNRVAATEAEVHAMRALLQPGSPAALQAAYLQVIATACADPNHDIDAAVSEVTASAETSTFPAQPGWEAAIDLDAVTAAMAGCEAGDA